MGKHFYLEIQKKNRYLKKNERNTTAKMVPRGAMVKETQKTKTKKNRYLEIQEKNTGT